MAKHFTPRRASVLAVACALLGACAEERAPIIRVQPDALDKSFFVGKDLTSSKDDPEFYAQGQLIDVGYGASQDGLFTSTYAQPMTRIKWVITEDTLFARLTYERIQDSDHKGAGSTASDGQVVGAYRIQSHFDIKREYNSTTGEEINVVGENSSDRPWYQRQYMRVDWSKNLNTDAYELDTLSQMGIYGGVKYEPLALYVNDPSDTNAPHFDVNDGYFDVTTKAWAQPQMLDLGYLGWGLGQFPACMLDADIGGGGAPVANCNPVELTIRQSFKKVVDHDYEPEDYDGHRFQAFGAFTTDRQGYARNYGMVDDKWHRFINRYNLWKQSHFYADPAGRTGAVSCFTPATTPAGADPHRDENGDGTEDECAQVGRGSRCDEFSQKCTLPYRDRQAQTVAWYYADGSNQDYFDGTEWAAHEWDVALRGSIQVARYTECLRTNDEKCAETYPVYTGQQDENQDAITLAREVDDCRNHLAYPGKDCSQLADELGQARGYSAGVIALAKLPEALVLCHSPVEANDPATCLPAGQKALPAGVTAKECNAADRSDETAKKCEGAFHVRAGDTRYHHVNVIPTPQTPSPWGIMVDSHDPLTGEKVAASVNVWSHVTDLWSQSVVDLSRYIKGELKTADVTEGTYIRDWAEAAAASAGGSVGRLTLEEQERKLAEFLGISRADLGKAREQFQKLSPSIQQKIADLDHDIRGIRADPNVPNSTRATYEARRKRAQGSQMEAQLTTKMMQQLAGLTGQESGQELVARASPLRGNSIEGQLEMTRRREAALSERGACIMREAPAPLAIASLASVLEDKFGKFNPADSKDIQLARAEKMRRFLAQRVHYSVVIHEMGHSIGLRHNFVSSAHAWNYRPQYWQLRTEDGTANDICTSLSTDGKCVGPRWFDPITDNEKKNLEWMFMQSTTMDYAGETAQDMVGLGAYDFSAARMFYSDAVAVHADASFKQTANRGVGVVDLQDNFGGLLGLTYQIGQSGGRTKDLHYSELQKNFQLIKDCQQVDPGTFKPARWNVEREGEWHPLVDGLIVQVGGKYTRCKQQKVDYVAWDKLQDSASGKSHSYDTFGRTRVPYGFATDRWADLGNLAVYRHDNGADPYELFDFLITQQETMHVFDNYRRHRTTFSVRGAMSRSLERYNEKIRDGAKGIALMKNIYKDFSLEVGLNFDQLWPAIVDLNYANNIMASGIAFDHFAKLLQRPQSGDHYLEDGVLRSMDDGYGQHTASVAIPNGATGYFGNVSFGGKPLENALARDRGEYNSEYVLWSGSYYEKAFTSMLMTESVDNFISSSRNDFLDARFRSISMADVFPDGYRRWLANNLTGDNFVKGARIAADSNGRPVKDSKGFPAGPIGFTSWWPAGGPETCYPTAESQACSKTAPANSVVVDPQVGWEQQKFLIANTLQYLPENQQQNWLNQLGIWEIGADTDPKFENRIEYHDPAGRIFVARTFGKETIFGKTVQKGIAARMLEYANELLKAAYEVKNGPDLDSDGQPDWYEAKMFDGQPRVKWDSTVSGISPNGAEAPDGIDGCSSSDNSRCTCDANRACVALSRYVEVPYFMREAMKAYGLADPSMRGIY